MNKLFSSAEEAIRDVREGSMIAVGGFFAAGVPRTLLQALIAKGVKDLTIACGSGPLLGASELMAELVENQQIRKVIDSYALPRSMSKGLEDPFEQQVRAGRIELEVIPMGTLAEKYRAAGAGIPAFYSPTGVGSILERESITNIADNVVPKETRVIDGKEYVLEHALRPDIALVHAYMGDSEGNLRYRKTARNFNHVMATAGKITIAEVEHLVEPGEIDSDDIHTPGIFVQRVVQVPRLTYQCGIA